MFTVFMFVVILAISFFFTLLFCNLAPRVSQEEERNLHRKMRKASMLEINRFISAQLWHGYPEVRRRKQFAHVS